MPLLEPFAGQCWFGSISLGIQKTRTASILPFMPGRPRIRSAGDRRWYRRYSGDYLTLDNGLRSGFFGSSTADKVTYELVLLGESEATTVKSRLTSIADDTSYGLIKFPYPGANFVSRYVAVLEMNDCPTDKLLYSVFSETFFVTRLPSITSVYPERRKAEFGAEISG